MADTTCPKCGFAQPAGGAECARCGVIFRKWKESVEDDGFIPASVAIPRSLPEDDIVENGRIGNSELRILGFGLVAAIVIYAIPFTRFVLSAMVTLFHELGHAVFAWVLGYPALPAFDFVYGGGFTHYGAFRLPIAIGIASLFAWGGWIFRRNPRTLAVLGVLFALWLLAVTAEWRRELVMASAGHVFEFVLAGILFYQSLAGVGWKNPALERPLGAFIAFFVQIHSMAFALKLRGDPDFLAWYREGKGGMLMNDLEQVDLDLFIHTGIRLQIEGVAMLLLLFSFVPIALGIIWFLWRARWHRIVGSLLVTEPANP